MVSSIPNVTSKLPIPSTEIQGINCDKMLLKRRRLLLKVGSMCILTYLCIHYWNADESAPDIMKMRMRRYLDYHKTKMNRTGPGEQGVGVWLSSEETKRAQVLRKKEGFNVVASDKISPDRNIRDHRAAA